nr:hypothetical protein [uncultured archaeon]
MGGIFVESSDGTLKMMYAPSQASIDQDPVPYIPGTFAVNQNDTMTVRANV